MTFDLAIWLAAAATALAAALARRPWRWTGFEIGWLFMLAGAIVSTVVTSNKRLAINCSADWLTAAALAWTIARLARTRIRVALVLAALIASGTVSATRCTMQVTTEQADTWQQYQQTKNEFWGKQNVLLDDPRVDLFERRMRAAEASGFFALANSQGAWLALAGFAGLSLTALRRRSIGLQIVLALLSAVLMSCILMTGGRGAMFAALATLVVLAAAWRFQERLRLHWRSILIVGWVAVVIAAVAVVAHGRYHGGLPGSSLNFRWQYWQVTSEIISDHFWPGVGAGNFDRLYLAYKPIAFPEEIKDPHNFALSVLAQWGAFGALGLLLALLGSSFVAARRWGHGDDPNGGQPSSRVSLLAWIAAGVVGFLALRCAIQSDLLSAGPGPRALFVFDLGFYGILWCVVFAALCWLDSKAQNETDGDGAYRLPLAAGVFAFLLANTIDISLFEPGPLTAFSAMVGLLLAGVNLPSSAPESPLRRFSPVVAILAILVAFLSVAFMPVVRSSHRLSIARANSLPAAIAGYQTAATADPLDPTPLEELAERSSQLGTIQGLNQAVDAINEAIDRDPDRLQLYRYRMALLEARYRVAGSASDLLGALGAGRHCVELYLESPGQHKELADLLARANVDAHSPELRDEAIRHYQEALRLNDARPGTDEARRWPQSRINQVRKCLDALLLAPQPATASSPTH